MAVMEDDMVLLIRGNTSLSYPLRRVVGPLPLVEAPVLEPIAISTGFWPISLACGAVAGLFQ